MPLMLYGKCWRGRTDCEAVHCIDAAPEDLTEEQFLNFDYTPESFVCTGIIATDARNIPQDCYRLCFKNAETDEISDNDIQDMAHVGAVVSAVLALHATQEVNAGSVQVPTQQGAAAENDVLAQHQPLSRKK